MGSDNKACDSEPAVSSDERFLVTTKFAPPRLNAGVIDRERLVKKLTAAGRDEVAYHRRARGFW